MNHQRPIVIFGCGDLAVVLISHLRRDGIPVAAVTADRDQIPERNDTGLDIIAFEDLEKVHPPSSCDVLVAVGYSRLNHARAETVQRCRAKGYPLTRYISKSAHVCEPLSLGENCIIFDGAIIHPFVEIGDNVIVWGASHVGHHSIIEDHCFFASGSIAGRSRLGAYTFLGSGAKVVDNIKVGKENIIGAGVVIQRDTKDGEVYRLPHVEKSPVSSQRLWKL